jgi:adenine-specific DNA-methyltransferase
VKQCIALATSEGDIVLDSFAGSGTTAQAVLELNEESGVERNFILVKWRIMQMN